MKIKIPDLKLFKHKLSIEFGWFSWNNWFGFDFARNFFGATILNIDFFKLYLELSWEHSS